MLKRIVKYRYYLLSLFTGLGVWYYFSLPKVLFDDPYATLLNAGNGQLLSARIAQDGQWHFPLSTSIPEKYEKALIAFEDKNFYRHGGTDLSAMGRALKQNLEKGRVVSGGSTLSMQVIRMHRKGKGRTVWEKLVEVILATRLEFRYTKAEILSLYASHAPYGGNTVGIEAAAWRYFGREANKLSWAEAALLAVLPNQPGLLFPGRHTERLKTKRNRLLHKLHSLGHFDAISLELAKAEPLPNRPQPLPCLASHLLDRGVLEGHGGKNIGSTLDYHLQKRVNRVVKSHQQLLRINEIHNAAALVIDIKKGEVLAYTGNAPGAGKEHADQVDVISAPRSTGSLLKPMLYAAALDDGMILPGTLIPDVPMYFGSFAPKNYSHTFDGAVPANLALSWSLNIPAVYTLKEYGYPRFHEKLREMGISTLTQSADHYGLSLILGGSEGTLWDMANVYAGMARTLNEFHKSNGDPYRHAPFQQAVYLKRERRAAPLSLKKILSAAGIWFAFEAMKELYRPDEEASWKLYSSSRKIAWKTGTSFGYRDGWAIGVTPDHVVAVWVGNADGEGRPGLTGIKSAAPIMFDIFDLLPESTWFNPPMKEMTYAAVDRQSGFLASPYSIEVDTVLIPKTGLKTLASPFHQLVHLDAQQQFRVHADCETIGNLVAKNWFVLPPGQAFYYRKIHPDYQELPPMRSDCYLSGEGQAIMEILYPEAEASLYLPRELGGERGEFVFEVAHRNPQSQLHWHLDDHYLGTTLGQHLLSLQPGQGTHVLTVTDSEGNVLKRRFNVFSEKG